MNVYRGFIGLLFAVLMLVPVLATGTSGPGCGVPTAGSIATSSGPVRGALQGTTNAFRGIPYAAQPVADLRFRPPQEPACSTQVLDATTFGPVCPQPDLTGGVIGDEDCLTLNIWAPAGAAPGSLPVMMFLHGGGNLVGASSAQLGDGTYVYDGQRLSEAAHVVVVTVNYRLGILGFLSLPQLDAESAHAVSGNYGLLDQIAALRWVRANITGFGGNPNQVLLFGQSAGAMDVCYLLTSPLAAGLFSAALTESGVCGSQTQQQVQAIGAQVVAATGCADAPDVPACLRGQPAATIVAARPGNTDFALHSGDYQPYVDGYVLPADPRTVIQEGQHNPVPLIVGANAAESAQMVPQVISTDAAYQQYIRAVFPGIASSILAMYPSAAYPSPHDAAVAATTDFRFICPARSLARLAAAHQSPPVFRYEFTHTLGASGTPVPPVHGLELLFVFDHLDAFGYVPTVDEQALASAIGAYWAQLARTGDPNGPGAVPWPRYVAGHDLYLLLDAPLGTGDGLHTAQCDFWDSLGIGGSSAPPNTLLIGKPASVAKGTATFSFAATQPGSTFQCQLDTAAFLPCTSPTTYTGLPQGSHSFQVRATNPTGSTDPTPASYTWTVDTSPPAISGIQVVFQGGGKVIIQWTTNELSTTRIDYRTLLTSFTSVTTSALTTTHAQLLTGLSPKTTYYYAVTSIDAGGNVATSPPLGSALAHFSCPQSGC